VNNELRDQLRRKTGYEVAQNRALLDEIRVQVGSIPWPGKTGPTDRRVLETCLAVAYECGQLVFTASTRQIALRAGCTRETAGISLGRLSQAGLTVLEPGHGARSSTLRIEAHCPRNAPLHKSHIGDKSKLLSCNSNMGFNGEISGQLIRSADPDLFRSGGLSQSDLQVFAALPVGLGARVPDLVESTGRGRSTVFVSLRRLEEVGLAFRMSAGWCRLDGSVDALREQQHSIAKNVMGTAADTRRQEDFYQQERSAYLTYCRQVTGGRYELGDKEDFADLPAEQQDYASDLAMRAAEHLADQGVIPPISFADLRDRAFRLVITASATPYEDFEHQAAYIAR
jgi:hypothetical protein